MYPGLWYEGALRGLLNHLTLNSLTFRGFWGLSIILKICSHQSSLILFCSSQIRWLVKSLNFEIDLRSGVLNMLAKRVFEKVFWGQLRRDFFRFLFKSVLFREYQSPLELVLVLRAKSFLAEMANFSVVPLVRCTPFHLPNFEILLKNSSFLSIYS